jgi:hypothetical protein
MLLVGNHLVFCPGAVKGHEHCWERDGSEREGFGKQVGKKRNTGRGFVWGWGGARSTMNQA